MCVASSICCSINIDNVKYLPPPSSVEVHACARVCVVFSLPVVRSDNYYHRLAVRREKKGRKTLSSSRSVPESDRQTVWDCGGVALVSYLPLLCRDFCR